MRPPNAFERESNRLNVFRSVRFEFGRTSERFGNFAELEPNASERVWAVRFAFGSRSNAFGGHMIVYILYNVFEQALIDPGITGHNRT